MWPTCVTVTNTKGKPMAAKWCRIYGTSGRKYQSWGSRWAYCVGNRIESHSVHLGVCIVKLTPWEERVQLGGLNKELERLGLKEIFQLNTMGNPHDDLPQLQYLQIAFYFKFSLPGPISINSSGISIHSSYSKLILQQTGDGLWFITQITIY